MVFCESMGEKLSWKHVKTRLERTSEPFDICMNFRNTAPYEVDVIITFVDWWVTADELQRKSCKSDEYVEEFWQYISWYNSPLRIPAYGTVEHHAYTAFPEQMSWSVAGCVTYRVDGDKRETADGMFDIIVRKAKFIDFQFGPKKTENTENAELVEQEPINEWEKGTKLLTFIKKHSLTIILVILLLALGVWGCCLAKNKKE